MLLAILFLVFSLLPSFLACFLASTKRGEGGLFYTTRDLDRSIDRSIAPSIGVGKFEAGDVERQPMDG